MKPSAKELEAQILEAHKRLGSVAKVSEELNVNPFVVSFALRLNGVSVSKGRKQLDTYDYETLIPAIDEFAVSVGLTGGWKQIRSVVRNYDNFIRRQTKCASQDSKPEAEE